MGVIKPLLNKRTILVTRPLGRADNLCALINNAGGQTIHYPVIAILPPRNNSDLLNIKQQLSNYDIAIFISPTAVIQTLKQISALPEHLQVAAIGGKTALVLSQQGVFVSIKTAGFNSESLLTHPTLQAATVSHQKIIIFRGEGGRAFLGDTLKKRGAQVCYVESYRRSLPESPALSAKQLASLDVITISSNTGLDNLMILLKNNPIVLTIPIIVASEKMLKNAQSYGFISIHLADNASDEACFALLIQLFG